MSVLLPPSSRSGSAVRPILQERKFRLSLKCLECQHEHPFEMMLYDEPNDPATTDDFYDSGVLDLIQFQCERCGHEHASYREVVFIEDATTVRNYGG